MNISPRINNRRTWEHFYKTSMINILLDIKIIEIEYCNLPQF